jgi:transcriptional regulator with PAS, ATPase and Fis domain
MTSGGWQDFIGEGPAKQDLWKWILKAAPTDVTVLIQGESGTGKELVAVAIHRNSRRAAGPFVALNCASLPESLIESELFGYEKGAFTGAYANRKGKFELAHVGTLFLDEIAELSPAAQPKLLRVLEKREVDRVGGERPLPVDFRLIAATNKDLEAMAAAGKFKEHLFYRLNVFMIQTLPLRDRPEDTEMLASHFALRFARGTPRTVRGVAPEVLEAFKKHRWPRNVRELQNILERAVIAGEDEWIGLQDLPLAFLRKPLIENLKLGPYRQIIYDVTHQLLVYARAAAGPNGDGAKLLGLTRASFYRLLKQHRLET